MIRIKRAYDRPEKSDGYRVLVDRLWPRGVKKEQGRIDDWAKDLAPSTELRKWFSHDPDKWTKFRASFRKELQDEPARRKLRELSQLAARKTVTLVYGAKDEEHNNAVVLKEILQRRARA